MKKIAFILAALVLPIAIMAQDMKFGSVNAEEIMMLLPEVSEYEKTMTKYGEENKKYLQGLQDEIKIATKSTRRKTEHDRRYCQNGRRKIIEMQQCANCLRNNTTVSNKTWNSLNLCAKSTERHNRSRQKNNFMFIFQTGSEVLYKSDKVIDVTAMVKKELGILQ